MFDFLIEFPEHDITLRAKLHSKKTPTTASTFLQLLSNGPLEVVGKHAMYTGKEISIQLPKELCGNTAFHDIPKENLTCFPQPGDLLFTFMPEYAWAGVPSPIYDVGLFYGRDARTFFPMGWLPGNLFSYVIEEDLHNLSLMGEKTHQEGVQKIIFRL
jgi:hypothetical protein